jgi:L-ascorbate metabolism protein UlaG (beta-lactamase superfamily)
MKITKLAHSCLLVEMPAPTNRTVLFDPGNFSVELVKAANLEFLDDIVITHEHPDHFNQETVVGLAQKFPKVRILAPQPVVGILQQAGVAASTTAPEGMELFEAPHESLDPMGKTPQAIGVYYLDTLTHPGDSHHFSQTKEVLALPITAPWGSTVNAVRLATELKPKIIIPVHDGFWVDSWRQQMYDGLAHYFEGQGIEFIQPKNGEPFVLNLEIAQAT